MVDVKNIDEVRAAATALENWFVSQEIPSPEASVIMCSLLARQAMAAAEKVGNPFSMAEALYEYPDRVAHTLKLELVALATAGLDEALKDPSVGEEMKSFIRSLRHRAAK